MRARERTDGLLRAPKLLWDVLVRGRYRFVYDMMDLTARDMSLAKRLNLVRAGGNLVRRRLRPWSMPLHMQFELTNVCNLRCPVCPTGARVVRRPPRFMDPELFERVIDEVGPTLLTASLWAWGEPLLHPEIERILRAIRRHDVVSLLSTNGQTLDREDVVRALVTEPPTHLIVALDGLTDETNTRFRKGARLAPALAGVRRIADIKRRTGAARPILHMRFIVMRHNQHELPDLDDFAREAGFDLLTVRTLSIIDTESHDLHTSMVPDLEGVRPYDYEDGARVVRDDYVCQEPFWFPSVFADGTVVACEQDFNATLALGSLADGVGFRELWTSDRAAEVRRVIRDRPETLSFCTNCPYRDREGTDCSIEARVLSPAIGRERAEGAR